MSGKKYKGPLPKSKPAKSTNKKTGATRGAGDDAEYMRKAAEANRYEDGGNVLSEADLSGLKKTMEITPEMSKIIRDIERSGKTFPPKRTPNKPISEKDLEKIKKLMKPLKYEDGGEVRGMGRAYQGKKRGCKIR